MAYCYCCFILQLYIPTQLVYFIILLPLCEVYVYAYSVTRVFYLPLVNPGELCTGNLLSDGVYC